MTIREILKKALRDPKLIVAAIIPEEYGKIRGTLDTLPDDVLISEWMHHLAYGSYEYHIHNGENASKIKELYDSGVRGGNPKLLRLYSKKDLRELIQERSTV